MVDFTWEYYLKDDETTYPYKDNFSAILAIGFGANVKYKTAVFSYHKKGWVSEGKVLRINRCCYKSLCAPTSVTARPIVLCTAQKPCEFEDDGYCFDTPKGHKCEYMRKINKYYVNSINLD